MNVNSFSSLCFLSVLCVLSAAAKTGKEIIKENGFKKCVDPMLTTQWSQNGGENSMLPFLDESHSMRAVTGCGATAVAQLMNYWQYPKSGVGYNYYYWNAMSGLEEVLYADFENTSYDWDNMISLYKGNSNATPVQKEAVSTLMAHVGVALEMKYDTNIMGEPSAGTQIEYINSALKKYFGYNPNMYIVRQINGAYSMDEWLTMIYRELSEGRPVLMGGRYVKSESEYADHIYVADGYDEEGRVHLNLGKANNSGINKNDYYNLAQKGVTYNENMRMILGITPYKADASIDVVRVSAPGSLMSELGGEVECTKRCRLKVLGTINNDDIKSLKKMTATTTGQLSYLDLSDCTIEGGIIKANAFQNCYTLQEIALPDNVTEIQESAFAGCRGLLHIRLPEKLEEMGSYAFLDCRYLNEINLPQSLQTLGTNPFRRVKLDKVSVDEANPNLKAVDGTLYSYDMKKLICVPYKFTGKYVIPDGVERLSRRAFDGCHMMDTLVVPASVKNLGDESFWGCGSLKCVCCFAETPPDHYATFRRGSSCVLHVPRGCRDAYIEEGWLDMFAEIIDNLESSNSTVRSPFSEDTNKQSSTFDMSGKVVGKNHPRHQPVIMGGKILYKHN